MSKYPNEQTVGAVYDDAPVGNPFLAAMPDMFPPEKVFEKIGSKLPIPHNLSDMTAEERSHVPGLPAGRADIIVAGAEIVTSFMDAYDIGYLVVSDRDGMEGMQAELVANKHV